jgi:hypothetical protein
VILETSSHCGDQRREAFIVFTFSLSNVKTLAIAWSISVTKLLIASVFTLDREKVKTMKASLL